MRKDLEDWRFYVEGESVKYSLPRFLIGFEELRVRLAPSRYPNIEISDEGHLWFNIETSSGIVEILAFPFGFKEIAAPFILVSFPRKAEDADLNFLKKLSEISINIVGTQLLAERTATTKDEILSAYKRNRHPRLTFTSNFDEILQLKKRGVFFSYLGARFLVLGKTVSEVERTIRGIISSLDLRIV